MGRPVCSWRRSCFSRSRSRLPSSDSFARAMAMASSSPISFFSRSIRTWFLSICASNVAFWSSSSLTICSWRPAISALRAATSRAWAAASGIRSTSRAFRASTVKGTWEQLPSRFEDRAEDGESALADLDRVLLHRVVGGPHLLHLQIANELAAGVVESEQHDPVDEEPLVPEELAVAFRIPFHHDERREFVVAEHLEEVEHPLAHVRRVLHQGVQRAERVEREELDLRTVDLPMVRDH